MIFPKYQITKLNASYRKVLISIILVLFFFSFYWIYNDIKGKTIKEFNREQLIFAKTASQGFITFFNEYQADLTFMSLNKNIQNQSDEGNTLLANFYETHKEIIAAITRIDADGKVLYTYPYNQHILGRNISDQQHVQKIISTHHAVISDVFMAVQGYLAIAIHVPVFKNKEFAGSIAMLIPIDALGKLYLEKINNKKNGHVWLLSENGIEIYCPIKGHTGKSFLETTQNNVSSTEVLKIIKTENSGTGNSIHQEIPINRKNKFGNMYFAFCRVPIGNTYWTILISYQEKDVYLALSNLRNRLIIIFSLLLITITFYFYSLAKVQNLLKEESKRKKTEKELQESEEKFRKLFEEHTAVKLLIEPDTGKIVDANKAASDYYGWSCEELKQMKIDDINTLTKSEIKKNMGKVLTEKRNQFEFKHRLKNGSIRDIEVFSSKIKIGGKELIHSIVHDITKRKQAEEEKARFINIIERSLNEIYVFDYQSLQFIYVNKGALVNLGYTLDEMMRLTPIDIKPEHTKESFTELIQPLLNKEKDRLVFQTVHHRKDQTYYPVEVFLQIVADGDQKVFLAVINDITERLEAERLIKEKTEEVEAQNEEYLQINEELNLTNQELIKAKEHAEESDRLKTAFLQNMSHEIRTPMNAIMGFSELLIETYNDKSKLENYSQIIKQRCKDLLYIINDILDIAKIESGQLSLKIEECNLITLFSEISDFFHEHKKQQGKQQIEFDIQIGCNKSYLMIYTDKVKLKQIFINLISNAFKFTEKGKIESGCKLDGNNSLVFYVSDTGIGIPNDKLNFIFERFAQLEQTPDHLYGGTGLGLPIVKGLLNLLGGTIWVESELGKGTTFYFSFPYKNVNTEIKEAVLLKEQEEYNFTNKTILIVDDDIYSANYIKEILDGTGFKIIHSVNGLEAIQIVTSMKLDIILMDIRLPDVDGYTATRLIKKLKPEIKIIAQTAYASQEDEEKAFNSGCNGFISKPIKRETLLSLINKHLT